MEKDFNEQDSLRLINEMITRARNNFQEGSVKSSIFSGYFVAATAIANYALIHLLDNPNGSFWIWTLMIPMMIISSFIDRKRDSEPFAKTHIDKIITKTWKAFAISVGILLASIIGASYAIKSPYLGILITPAILTMMGAAQYVTSIACRFKPYSYGALVFWGGALLCTATYFTGQGDLQFIVLAACAILGLSMPGHFAIKKAKQNV